MDGHAAAAPVARRPLAQGAAAAAAPAPIHPATPRPGALPPSNRGGLFAWACAVGAAAGRLLYAIGAAVGAAIGVLLGGRGPSAAAAATSVMAPVDNEALRLAVQGELNVGGDASVAELARAGGRQLAVCALFGVDFPRSQVVVGADGARPASLEAASDALVALCDGDVDWARQVSSMMSQNLGNSIVAASFGRGLLAIGDRTVQSWANAPSLQGGPRHGHLYAASRHGDAVRVHAHIAGELALVQLDGPGPGGGQYVPCRGPLVMTAEVQVRRPQSGGGANAVQVVALAVGGAVTLGRSRS